MGNGTSGHTDDFGGWGFFFHLVLFHFYVQEFLLKLLSTALFPDHLQYTAMVEL